MSFLDSAPVARAADRLEFLDANEHHDLCPQHPWNNVFDGADPCECDYLRKADESDAAEHRADARKEG